MAWLSGWETAKRIPITVDSSKVDSTLTDFPVLINISASSGITSQDLTGVFDELSTDYASNTTHENEDCADITDWSDFDNATGVSSQVSYGGKSCFKFDTGANLGAYAQRRKDVGSFGNRVVVEISLYHSAIGTYANGDYFLLYVRKDDVELRVLFASDGLYVYDGAAYNEVGTNIVSQGTWQTWVFDCNFNIPATAVCEVYCNGLLKATNVDCSSTGAFTNGLIILGQNGNTTANRISYVDYIKVGDTLLSDIGKIALTTSDGVIQCSVEIEKWNITDQTALLWAKIPTVVSGSDTELYLYYDSSQDINMRYIGEYTAPKLSINKGEEGTEDSTHSFAPGAIKDGDTYKMWYSGNDGLNWEIIYCDSSDGISWSNHQKVVSLNTEGVHDTGGTIQASVVKDGSTYKMWYSGYGGAPVGWRILYCVSNDGINWANHQLVVDLGDEGTYDTTHSYAPTVIKDGSTYKMWYAGHDGANWRVIYCTSVDGKNWANHQMVINMNSEGTYDTGGSAMPTVIKEDSVYKMWYSGYDGANWRIIYCDSSNGTSWSNHEMVIPIKFEGTYDTTHSYSAFVLKDDIDYKMWYAGSDGANWRVIYVNSYDGTFWGTPAQAVWDSNFLEVHHMVEESSTSKDSTSNDYDSTWYNGPYRSTGKMGYAMNFDGSNDYIDSSANVVADGTATFEGWFNLTQKASDKGTNIYLCPHFYILSANDYIYFTGTSDLFFSVMNTGWSYVAIKYSGNTATARMCHDGSFLNCTQQPAAHDIDAWAGTVSSDSNAFYGKIDEFRVSTVARGDEWLKASYYSGDDNFLTFGSPQFAVGSPDTNQIIHGNPYYNASSQGVEIYNSDISIVLPIAYITYGGGINSITLDETHLYMATTNSGIFSLPLSTVSGTDTFNPTNLTSYISQFKSYPNITNDYVKYIHKNDDYMCCVTLSGVDHFNFGESEAYDRSYTTASGIEKCWQTSRGRFYYTTTNSVNTIYTHQCDWSSAGYSYATGSMFLPTGCEVNDLSVSEDTSLYGSAHGLNNNTLFIATTSGITVIEERPGNEANSRYKQYTTTSGLLGASDNFTAITAEYDSTFDNTNFACISYGTGAGLNIVRDDVVGLFWPSTVSGTGNNVRQDASDLISVR